MESDREPLIPEAPRLSLPVLPRVVIGKWFWIGLSALLALAVLVVLLAHGVTLGGGGGPGSELRTLEVLGGTNALSFAYATMRTLFATPAVAFIAMVLLCVAFVRPRAPDRVLFVPATALAAGFASLALIEFAERMSILGAGSFPITIAIAGWGAIALVVAGLPARLRTIVWIFCGFGVVQEFVVQYVIGAAPSMLLGGALLGYAVLAFCLEIAEQCGADLFAVDVPAAGPHVRTPLSWLGWALVGVIGLAFCIVVGVALTTGRIGESPGALRTHSFLGIGTAALQGWTLVLYRAWRSVGSATSTTLIAAALTWAAFLRPSVARWALFVAVVAFGACIIDANAFLFRRPDSSGVDYPGFEGVLAIAEYAAIFIVARGLATIGRRLLEAFCVLSMVVVIFGQLMVGVPSIDILGQVVLAVSCIALVLAIACRSGIDMLASTET